MILDFIEFVNTPSHQLGHLILDPSSLNSFFGEGIE